MDMSELDLQRSEMCLISDQSFGVTTFSLTVSTMQPSANCGPLSVR